MAETFGELFGTPIDEQQVNEFAQLRMTQQQTLQQHQEYGQQLQQAEQGVQQRQQDIAATGQFFRLLDTNLPRNARQFMFNESARALGVDPKAETAAEVGKLLTSLDPQSAQAVRVALAAEQERAGPGAMRQLYTGILRGQVPISELMQRVQQANVAATAQTQQEIAGAFPGRPSGDLQVQNAQAGSEPEAGGEAPPAAAPPRQADGRTPLQQFVDPGLSTMLPDVPTGATATVQDLAAAGYSGPILTNDPAEQRRIMNDIRNRNAGVAGTLSNLGQIQELLEGRGANIIGATGTIQRWSDTAQQQLSALWNLNRDVIDRVIGSPENIRAVESAARRIEGIYPSLANDAAAAARLRSLLAETAYGVARQNEPGGRIANADYQAALQQLGASGSPGQMTAVIRDVMDRQWNSYSRHMTETAGRIPFRFDRLSEELGGMEAGAAAARLALMPAGMVMELQRHRQAAAIRQSQAEGGPLVPALPGQPAGERLPATTPTDQPATEQRPAAQPATGQRTQRMTPEQERAEQQRLAAEEHQRQRTIQEERLVRERTGEQRAVRGQERAEESHTLQFANWYRQQTWRDQDKAEAEKRRIEQAFQRLGAMIAGGRQGSVSLPRSGGGGEQDARAFQLPARRERRAPAVPRARGRGGE